MEKKCSRKENVNIGVKRNISRKYKAFATSTPAHGISRWSLSVSPIKPHENTHSCQRKKSKDMEMSPLLPANSRQTSIKKDQNSVQSPQVQLSIEQKKKHSSPQVHGTVLRRSERKRRRPFEYWKGERYVYGYGKNCWEIIGIKLADGRTYLTSEVEQQVSGIHAELDYN